MGVNASGEAASGLATTREVTLTMHAVHNVQHNPTESYYGMATNHWSDNEIPVTSEKPARMEVDINTIVSVRVYLHARGQPSGSDRSIGQLSIPVREMMEICGPGIYQTWMLLEPWTHYGARTRNQIGERFRRALMETQQELQSPRIMLTMLESSVDPAQWAVDEQARAFYYQPLLVSHGQSTQAVKAYFDHCEREELAQSRRGHSKKSNSSSHGAVEASYLRAELEKLQQQQSEDELAALNRELQELTDEANRRIEQGNETILRLKADIRQLIDVEEAKVMRERQDASDRLEAANRHLSRLRDRQLEGHFGQAPKLNETVRRLAEEKAALMLEVQEIYRAQTSNSKGSFSYQSDSRSGGSHENLLPDPREVLGSVR
eukprot:TRINITY_DN4193_c0_g4_i1.p1 TRINITY_DN4193_c0_g4~~TRINITY_DN4193_c0_g4_i1.p1  ORF type:complete len:377 (+),score=64.36 TRINITY_DN4193_c0_g4_i1:62-1192(+)